MTLEDLSKMDYEMKKKLYPSVPDHAVTKAKFSDKTANALTAAIIRFLELKGHACWRQSSEGRFRPGETTTDVLGHRRQTPGKWLPGQNRGAGDVSCVLKGRFCSLEIKIGKDRIRPAQVKFQKLIEGSGGVYAIVKSWDDFYVWYGKLN